MPLPRPVFQGLVEYFDASLGYIEQFQSVLWTQRIIDGF